MTQETRFPTIRRVDNHFDLSGEITFVTGATSGLGRHFARVLARSGAAVALAGRRRDRLESAKAEIEKAGGRAAAIVVDVTDAAALAPALDAAEEALGPISILVNNAGLNVQSRAVDLDTADFDRLMSTNLRAPFLLATEMGRRMIARGRGGRIVNIGSIGTFRPLSGLAAYCMSKAAIGMMTQSLGREWARYEINVNALCPGYVPTELNSEWFAGEAGRKLVASFPRRRLMAESDLDDALLFLASGRAVTGTLLTVDDGQSL